MAQALICANNLALSLRSTQQQHMVVFLHPPCAFCFLCRNLYILSPKQKIAGMGDPVNHQTETEKRGDGTIVNPPYRCFHLCHPPLPSPAAASHPQLPLSNPKVALDVHYLPPPLVPRSIVIFQHCC